MRKFNFRKLGILLAMMFACGMALVGPVSAYAGYAEALSDNGDYSVRSSFIHRSVNDVYYDGAFIDQDTVWASIICFKIELFNHDTRVSQVSSHFDDLPSGWLAETYTGGCDYATDSYAKSTVWTFDPDEVGYVYCYMGA